MGTSALDLSDTSGYSVGGTVGLSRMRSFRGGFKWKLDLLESAVLDGRSCRRAHLGC